MQCYVVLAVLASYHRDGAVLLLQCYCEHCYVVLAVLACCH
jgi:hypothetical protein